MIRRKPPKRSSLKSPAESWRSASESDRAKLRAEQARVTGAEYRSVYLVEVFKMTGCDICTRYRLPAQQHHVRTGGMGRKASAEESVIICYRCHRAGHDKGFAAVLAAHGLPPDHLDLRAAEHAATATAAGYLPVELCEECGKWHSSKFMLWEVQAHLSSAEEAETIVLMEALGVSLPVPCLTRRICARCAPEGPP